MHLQSLRGWRRGARVLWFAAGVLLVLRALASCHEIRMTSPQPVPKAVTIVGENALVGTSDWLVPNEQWADPAILSVWGRPYAAQATDTLSLYVHSTSGDVDVDLYRLGWYSGMGGRLAWHAAGLSAGAQPPCTPPGDAAVTCPWSETVRVPLDASWTPGLYVARARNAAKQVWYYPFVVRGPLSARVAVVIPQFTWQAYNSFGGSSLYTKDAAGVLYHRVSFERPYVRAGGSHNLFRNEESFELKVARWLERMGMDVSYISDVDLAMHRPLPNGTKVLLFAGHDEYWTWDEFSYVESLRDAGTHLMFLAGNAAYWNVRLEKGPSGDNTVIVCYKSSTDPGATRVSETTSRFRDQPLNRPEAALYGISYFEVAPVGRTPLYVSDTAFGGEAALFMGAASLARGDSVPGFVGGEGDRPMVVGSPPNLQVLFRSPDRATGPFTNHYYYTTFFIAPSGAGVFAAGNNYFARSLDDLFDTGDPRMQQLMTSVLDWMLAH